MKFQTPTMVLREVAVGILLALAIAGMAISLQAQVVTVTIQGHVYDSTGAAVSQANVTVSNAETGLSRSVVATSTGDYQVALLPVGRMDGV